MSHEYIDGKKFKQSFEVSGHFFEKNVDYINSLNVFPVPDGDTGTNMNLTIKAAAEAIEPVDTNDLGAVVKKLSRGMLLGARGNSGVILSQIWRGISQSLEKKSKMNSVDFAEALQNGSDVAYRSVMKPVEGTILTVIRETAEAAKTIAMSEKDFVKFLEKVVKASKVSLDNTPNLLPVLKEVGAVDSGGQGLVTLFEGMLKDLQGETSDSFEKKQAVKLDLGTFEYDDEHGDDEFGFCTEFIIQLAKPEAFDEDATRKELDALGESLVLVNDEEILKVHIHTETPLDIFAKYGSLGEFLWIKAENMEKQFSDRKEQNVTLTDSMSDLKNKEKIGTALIAVSSGSGIAATFKDLGVNAIVDGGQTQNPSTKDILEAIESIDADSYVILPNNGNIILAAEQVKNLTDKAVEIVPSKTIPEGLAAVIAFNATKSASENVSGMVEAVSYVRSGEVTTAVRNTNLNGVEITENDFLSIFGKEIVASEKDLITATKKLLIKMIDDDAEIVTLIRGEGVTDEIHNELVSYIENEFEDVEVETINGEQQVYFYLVSVE